jgi:PAS domain S-box-containing protein
MASHSPTNKDPEEAGQPRVGASASTQARVVAHGTPGPELPGQGRPEPERWLQDRTAELTRVNEALQAEVAQRRQTEEQLRRVNRAHLALSRCNQVLTRSRDETTLLEEICRVIVGLAGYRLCWVGYADEDEGKTVRPVAQAGYEAGYLQTVRVTWADTERGRGPSGTAVRTRRPSVFQDAAGDPRFAPWRDEALKRGYASVLGIPLLADSTVLGALTIYASEPDAFDAQEVELLEALANDLAYGVLALRTRAEHTRAEEALREARDELERRVEGRTAELARANGLLRQEIAERERSEGELRKSRERFEVAVRGSGDGIWDWDLETDEVYFSPRWKGQLGYEDHELPNAYAEWEGRLHPEDREATLASLRAYLEGRAPAYEPEFRLRHKDGSYRWILARAAALRHPDGRPYRLAGSHTDITRRKRAEEELAYERYLLKSLMDTVPDCIYFKDRDSRFLRINRALAERFGFEGPAAALGKTDFDLFTEEHARQAFEDEQEIIRTGRPVVGKEEKETWPDGRVTWASTTKMPLRDAQGALVGTFGISRDISRRKRIEEELRQAKEAAEAASRAKSAFLAAMSHEIRTPMNGILGMTELTLDTQLTPEQRDYLSAVKKSSEALLSILNDILDFSKIEADRLELDRAPFGLREVVGDTLATLALAARQKGLGLTGRLAPDAPDSLVGDPGRLRQVLVNLVGNAIKFTERGEVVMEVESAQGPGGGGRFVPTEDRDVSSPPRTARGEGVALHFAVRDTGTGIPADKQETIFEPFAQVGGALTRVREGTGLGLAIASRLVGMMGGRLRVESQVGKGSTFEFTAWFGLGQASPAPAEPPAPAAAPHRPCPRRLRVLLAEDNPVNQKLAVSILHKQGHAVVVAGNGREALAALGRGEFDLVLMDVQMPEMDGLEATKQLRAWERGTGRHVPVIAMTAYAMKGDRERCLQAGMDGYLAKPVRTAELLQAIESSVPPPAPLAPGPNGTPPNGEDRSRGEALAGGEMDRQLLAELAGLFLGEWPKWLAAIRTAVTERDPARLQLAAHALKGGLGTFSARSAWESALRLETMGRRGDLSGAEEALAEVVGEVERLRPALASLAKQAHGPPTKASEVEPTGQA